MTLTMLEYKTEKPKTIGLFTSFYAMDAGYSLCSVVRDQLTALVKNHYRAVLFVLPSFKDDDKVPAGVEIRKVIPQIILEPYKGLEYPQHWKEDVIKVKEALEKHATDITHMICHDIFFIDTYLPYNIGLREARLNCKIFAWTHSAPSTRPRLENNPHANRYTLPPRTTLVYLNYDQANDIAEMYGAWLKDVRVINNSRDPRTFWNLDEFTVKLVDKYDLLNKDIISTYPLSTPRMISGKGLDRAVKIHSKLKELGYKTLFIVANAHANAPRDKQMIKDFYVWAADRGITPQDLVFTSLEEVPYHEQGVSPRVVSDLFRLSNVFIFPTVSENCSLVLLEAMGSGNLLALNKKVPSLKEFGGHNALYFDFDYKDGQSDNEIYYKDLAKIIANQFENNKSLQAKRTAFQKFNYDYIFNKLIEPLFYDQD